MTAIGGIDYAKIGMAMGYRDAIRLQGSAIANWQAHAEMLERRLSRVRAEHEAHNSGRLAEVKYLRRALANVAPSHPALQVTDRVYGTGSPEYLYEAAYDGPYDEVAHKHGLPPCRATMRPEEWADAREQEVLDEPIEKIGWWVWERFVWRGVHYRTAVGATCARTDAAKLAREAQS